MEKQANPLFSSLGGPQNSRRTGNAVHCPTLMHSLARFHTVRNISRPVVVFVLPTTTIAQLLQSLRRPPQFIDRLLLSRPLCPPNNVIVRCYCSLLLLLLLFAMVIEDLYSAFCSPNCFDLLKNLTNNKVD